MGGPVSSGSVSRARLREVVAREVRALLRSDVDDDPIGDLDDETVALLTAMAELDEESGVEGRAWNPAEHKRWPKGHPQGGKFRSMVELLKMAIANHDGKGDPFQHFNREQLRKAAKARGITLKRGEGKDSIAARLLADLGGAPSKEKATVPPKAAKKAATPASPPASAIPGVTLERIQQIFGDTPDAYGVNLNGERIGHIHGNEADPHSEWMPFRQANARWRLRNPGAKPSKEAAIKELVDSYGARPRGPASAPQAGASSGAVKTDREKFLDRLIPQDTPSVARELEIKRIVEEKLNGQYAGLTVKVTSVGADRDVVHLEARIFDDQGKSVGEIERQFSRAEDGTLRAYHMYLKLNPDVQGQGFAQAWNGHLENWYRDSGVGSIHVGANIDVGGYAWARQGFDFESWATADGVAGRLKWRITQHATRYDTDQIAAAREMIDRMRLPFDDPRFPTAYEVSETGRKPGQGRNDFWPGKDAMLGSSWNGIKPVPTSGAPTVS